MMTEELLESINHRLGLMLKTQLRDELSSKSRKEQVKELEDLDFRDKDIADVLGITENNLGTIRARMEDNEDDGE